VVKRRTLDDGLTPEEMAFLTDGSEAAARKAETRNRPENPAGKQATTVLQTPASAKVEERTETHVQTGMMGLNTRVGVHINAALLRASTDRKIERRSRAAVQDIVNEALTEWLMKAGYITQ
jgi:hypothetical protein